MFILFGVIADKIVSMVLDEIVAQLKTQLLKDLQPQIISLTRRLDTIEKKFETIPLQAAFTFLSLGKHHEAQNEFVRACVANPQGAVARLWLGVLLYQEGQQQEGLKRFKEAISMNPYVAPPQMMNIMLSQLHTFGGLKKIGSSSWKQKLEEKSLVQKLPPSNNPLALGHWLPSGSKVGGLLYHRAIIEGSILAASTSGGNPVILWDLTQGLDSTRVLSAFDLSTGDCLWSIRVPDKHLYFATSSYVVLTSDTQADTYELYAMETGKFIATMERKYYELVFCPNNSQLQQLDGFKIANCVMTKREDFYEMGKRACASQLVKIHSVQDMLKPQHPCIQPYKEEFVLMDPFKLGLFLIRAVNEWEYKNLPRGYRGLSRRIDKISCNSNISNG